MLPAYLFISLGLNWLSQIRIQSLANEMVLSTSRVGLGGRVSHYMSFIQSPTDMLITQTALGNFSPGLSSQVILGYIKLTDKN